MVSSTELYKYTSWAAGPVPRAVLTVVVVVAVVVVVVVVIMYIYHALINALSAHMIHINLKFITIILYQRSLT